MKDQTYLKEWQKVDSLLNKSLPKSAEKAIQDIYVRAKAANQPVQMMKAQMYLLRTAAHEEYADTAAIRHSEANLSTASFPFDLVWHSIIAQLYYNYYEQHRWQLLNRTTLDHTTSANIAEWDAAQFHKVIGQHYRKSLDLKAVKVSLSGYEAILEQGQNTRHLRPTLYDLLAFRALSYFKNDERDLHQPAYRFELDDAGLLAPAAIFIREKINSRDSTSLRWQALALYQQILAFHEQDTAPDAFVDADLQRIAFVYNNATFPDKKQVYERTLKAIADKAPGSAAHAKARYLLLASQMNTPADGNNDEQETTLKRDLPRIKKELEAIVAKFPNSEAASNAAALLQNITERTCTMIAEETVLPDMASKILVTYRNVPQVYFRVIKLDEQNFLEFQRMPQDTFYQAVLRLPVLQSFHAGLPATEDFESHRTEVKIDALPAGAYVVIASAKEDFSNSDNIIAHVRFQVTDLALIQINGSLDKEPSGFAVHRKSGEPVRNAGIIFYKQVYNSKKQSYDYRPSREIITGNDGSFLIQEKNVNYGAYRIKSSHDIFYSPGYFSNYRETPQVQKPVYQAFFLTDRSIYRPGQTIYFKGIIVSVDNDHKKTAVVPGMSTTVSFYDANSQLIARQTLTTNEYGSVTGSFTAPSTGLTGSMYISNDYGSQNFSVEEYKRPKFAVSFDTLKGTYALDERITVKGFAKGYAGNNIDGATVKYTVKRQARWPFWYDWWRPMPYPNEQDIAHGTTTTDADGSFTVAFFTIPDRTIDSSSLPVFSYTVSADVTDASGETHSGTERIQAGYNSIVIKATIPEKTSLSQFSKITVSTTNLNGIFVAAKTNIRITRLEEPGFTPRARLWATPDQFVIDEPSFRKYFPLDEYRRESKPQSWKAGTEIWQTTITTTDDGVVKVPQNTFRRNGWYCVELSTTDKSGSPLKQKHYVQLYDASLDGLPTTALSIFGKESTYEPGNTAHLKAISSFNEAYLFQTTTGTGNSSALSQAAIANGGYSWKKTITEEDRGGITLNWLMIRNNRVYNESAYIAVPWTNKELQISWETHRDKLLPGAKETWTMNVSGSKKEKIAAEMIAGMYDASLDAFAPHSWNVFSLWPQSYSRISMQAGNGFNQVYGINLSTFNVPSINGYYKRYDALIGFPTGDNGSFEFDAKFYRSEDDALGVRGGGLGYAEREDNPRGRANVKFMAAAAPVAQNTKTSTVRESVIDGIQTESAPGVPSGQSETKDILLRKNLQETAFFFPQLKTDKDGNIRFEFTMPEALTEWKVMALAHTKEMQTGMLTGKIQTQKDLMVQPNLPRFFRQGDELVITTKISNLSDADLNGTAVLEIVDAQTLQSLNIPFRLKENKASFTVAKGLSTTASWTIHVAESRYEPVLVRISAKAGNFTDGEENMLPVLTNRTLVTETLPLWMNGAGSKTFSFDKLAHSDTSKTLAQHRLTVEYTGNPAWYAIQALPYLMEYPYECAEQTFNRYYAHALAAHILDKAPKVKELFEQWEHTDTAALMSNLEKNQELKTALLEETPWVLEAKNERQQKHNIALLFNSHRLGKAQEATLKKLEEMLLPEGAFPWFKGSTPDRYITQYIATGIARLQHLGVTSNRAEQLLARMLPYLDKKITEEYDYLVKHKAKMTEQHISYAQVQYLYLHSFNTRTVPNSAAFNYYKQQAARYWTGFNTYMKGMIALSLYRLNDKTTSMNILASLKETALHNEEMGMYWRPGGESYWWYEAPVECQALMIECFSEAGKDETAVNELRRWLLKQKQTQNWSTTKATADACYALLLKGAQWLTNTPEVTIRLGNETVSPSKTEAGTGYFKQAIDGKGIQPAMSRITVTAISTPGNSDQPSYGAVYWQYFEHYDKITTAKTPLALRKQLFIERNTDRGAVLKEIHDGNELKVGDKVKVRIILQSDRAMEYLHLKDMRAACFEPVNVLSGYRYQGGLGYYESTRDASSNFFISYLSKGTYVFEYSVNVMAKGDFSNGISTIQCMYAPEFSSHSEGIKVKVH